MQEASKRKELEELTELIKRQKQQLEQQVADSEQKAHRELESRIKAEERRRKDLEDRIAEEERKRKELEDLTALIQKQKAEFDKRTKDEEKKKSELEKMALEVDRQKKQLEERIAAEDRRRQEEDARRAAEKEELRKAGEEARQQRKELEERIAAEDRRRQEEEARREVLERERKETEEEALRASAQATEQAQLSQEQQKALDEMRRRVEELTLALEQEKRARDEIRQQHLENVVKPFRTALNRAWEHGAPTEEEAQDLGELAASLGIPESVRDSVQREVKLEMYSKAVKEVVSKKRLIRNSSSTLEWLRKVYQISMAEYLENESKFLLDLVADQYRGTVLLVSAEDDKRTELSVRLKAAGYAVVAAPTPENALEKIERVSPSVIVSQMTFSASKISGVKLLHLLRASPKVNFVPFVLLGTEQEAEEIGHATLRPNEGFLAEPIEFEELTALMEQKIAVFKEYVASLN